MTVQSVQDNSEHEQAVTPLELLFDLVFVFGVAQLSHHLLTHLSWQGAGETLVLLLAIFAVWARTSWSATMISVDLSRTPRLMLAVMLLGLFMNASVTNAFTVSGWGFVIPYLLIQFGRTIWTYFNAPDVNLREHYLRVLFWLFPTTLLWIVGAVANPDTRLLWWGLAAGIDLIGTWLAHPVPGRHLHSEHISFDVSHMLERCRLFLLIALGETIVTAGTAVAESPITPMTIMTGTAALAGTIALWTLNFGHSQRLNVRYRMETHDPIRIGRYAVIALLGLCAGLIALAVGYELVIAHPEGESSIQLSLLLYGGPILYLLAQSWYLYSVTGGSPRLRFIGIGILSLIGLLALTSQPFIALILLAATLAILAIFDQRTIRTDEGDLTNPRHAAG